MALIQYLTQIPIDFGAAALLPAECAKAGMKAPLIITDAGVRAAGVLAQAMAAWGPESKGQRPAVCAANREFRSPSNSRCAPAWD